MIFHLRGTKVCLTLIKTSTKVVTDDIMNSQSCAKNLGLELEMKDSGVEWIGEVPKHWKITRLKYVASKGVQYGLNIESESYEDSGVRFLRVTDIDSDGTVKQRDGVYLNSSKIPQEYYLKKGDVIFARSGSVGKSTLIASISYPMSFAGYLVRFSFDHINVSKFVKWVAESKMFWNWIDLQLIQSTIPNVNGEKYSNFSFAIPTSEEQKLISRYLDKKTEQIDSLIEKIQKKIELLKEQRTALINQCVTKGLDSNVEMKDSGVEWIGEIPKHWETRKLKHLVSYNAETLTEKTDPDYRFHYIEIGDVDYIEGVSINEKITFDESPSRARRIVKPKDVIVSTVRTYLRAIGIIPNLEDIVCSTGFCVLRDRTGLLDQDFLSYSVRSEWFISSVISNSSGVSYPAINSSELVELKIVLPPLDEQKSISRTLTSNITSFDRKIQLEKKRIELLQEYRQSLISSVVTGKVRVTEDMI